MTATGVDPDPDPDPADPAGEEELGFWVFSDGDEAYITHCQLRASSESISASAEQYCSSTKTRTRTFIASLKMGGLVVGAEGSFGRTRVVVGPGGGWIEVVKVMPVGFWVAIVDGSLGDREIWVVDIKCLVDGRELVRSRREGFFRSPV